MPGRAQTFEAVKADRIDRELELVVWDSGSTADTVALAAPTTLGVGNTACDLLARRDPQPLDVLRPRGLRSFLTSGAVHTGRIG
jgi:hypothetical protein